MGDVPKFSRPSVEGGYGPKFSRPNAKVAMDQNFRTKFFASKVPLITIQVAIIQGGIPGNMIISSAEASDS